VAPKKKDPTKRYSRWTDMRPAQGAYGLDLAAKKLNQADVDRAPLRSADLNASTPSSGFARKLADYGVLIREIKNQLSGVPGWDEWWNGTMPDTPVRVAAADRECVDLMIDACNDEHHHHGPGLTQDPQATHRHEFVMGDGRRLPVIQACDRAFGLMKEAHRVLSGKAIP
jgi:hypothetical protein